MGIVSGGGGGGNTTAQVVASGKVLPVADTTAVTVDTTTYDDPFLGSGKLTTLVFTGAAGALAIAISGDAHPRVLLGASANDGIYFGDGTIDAYNSGAEIYYSGGLRFYGGPGNVVSSSGKAAFASAAASNQQPIIQQVSPKFTITSGALPTVQLVTATGAQIITSRDAETITPCTFNPGAATTATVTVELSPDNVTYSTLGVETEPAGVSFDGTVHLVKVRVPAGWYLKLTVNAQAVLGLTTYY